MIAGEILDIGGGVYGTPYGLIERVAETIAGAATLNGTVSETGLKVAGKALSMPRLGSHGGFGRSGTKFNAPIWPESNTKVNRASIWHDWFTSQHGYGSAAQFGWIQHAWFGPGVEPGSCGQAYRLLGTIDFGIFAIVERLFGYWRANSR
jgi:hypothetical protein